MARTGSDAAAHRTRRLCPSINALLHSLQPTMVINNRGFDDGDFGTPERDYNQCETDRQIRFARPTEACNSVGSQSWGYRKDEDYYSSSYLIGGIDSIFAKGGNYLLNIGPDAQGVIPEQASQILREIGDWYQKSREAFGDAEPASDLTTNRDVLLTLRGQTLYVHITDPVKADAVVLSPFSQMPTRAVLLNTGDSLRTSVDLLPTHWQDGKKVLCIKGLPRNLLAGGSWVVRLDFDAALPLAPLSGVNEFRG